MRRSDETGSHRSLGQSEPEVLKLRGACGQELSAKAWGQGRVRTLLLHGVGDHARVWDPVAAALVEAERTLALDLRGHGDSGRASGGDYSRAAFAADLTQVMADLAGGPIAMVGHSLGGSLALTYAAEQPARVACLVLVDVGPKLERAGVERVREGLVEQPRVFETVADYRRYLSTRYWLADAAALAAFAAHGVVRNPAGALVPKLDGAALDVLRGPDRESAGWNELRRVRCPTLVLRAMGSAVLSRPTAQRMVGEALVLGELEEVAAAGHAVMLDQPAEVARRVARFLERHGGTPGSDFDIENQLHSG